MYGPTITPTQAKSVAAPAMAEARKNQWTMAIAIVDTAGDLVYFEKMDDTQVGSVDVAIAKARSAARFKRPTKAFQDALAAGGEGLADPVARRRHRRRGRHSRSSPAARSSAPSARRAAPAQQDGQWRPLESRRSGNGSPQ